MTTLTCRYNIKIHLIHYTSYNMNKAVLTLSIILALCATVRAQEDKSTYNENVIVTGSYTPEVTFMPKVNVAPAVSDTSATLQHDFSYAVSPRRLTSIFDPSQIKAARIIAEPKKKLYHNYLRIGMGNYWSPMLEAYHNSTASRNHAYGISLGHHSSWGTIGPKKEHDLYYGANHYSLTNLELFGRYNIKGKTQVYGTFDYQNDYNMFYGFADTTLNNYKNALGGTAIDSWRDSIKNSDLGSMYNYLRFTAGARSLPTGRSPWGYDANIGVSDLIGSLSHNEFTFTLNGMVSRKIESVTAALQAQWYQMHHKYSLDDMPLAFTPDSNMEHSESRTLVNISPNANFVLEEINAHIGATVALDAYTHPGEMKAYLLPDITLSRNFMDNALALKAGAVGVATPNSWNIMRIVNPYAVGNDDLRAMRHYSYFLQAHYKVLRRLYVDAKASYNRYREYMTYELDPRFALHNVFRPKYESFSQTVLGADVSFVNDEMLNLSVGGTYYTGAALKEDTLPGLYHPSFDLHMTLHLNYNDRWLFHMQGLMLSKMNADYAYNNTSGKYEITATVPMRYGFDAEVEYRHNRALSFFMRIENIACQRYCYWLNYPSKKIQVTLGLTYTL